MSEPDASSGVLPGRVLLGSLPATPLPYEAAGGGLNQIYTPDLDGDGASDLVVLSGSFPTEGSGLPQPGWVAFGDGQGRFVPASEARFPRLPSVHAREVVFADFNGDGDLDVFIADHGLDMPPFPGAQNRLYLSNGDGSWRDATAALPQQRDFTHSVSVGDIDGDRDLDIVVGNSGLPSYLYVLRGDGRGAFTPDLQLLPTDRGELLDPTRRNALSSTVADLDGDGRADLVLGTGVPNPERVPAQVLWSDRGRFDAPALTNLPWPAYLSTEVASPLTHDIQALDVDFDGDLDLVLAWAREVGREGYELQVLVNDGRRGFVDRTETYIPDAAARDSRASGDGNWIQFLLPADLNDDGRTDFVVDARRGATAAEMPMALVHQPDGHFEVFRPSDTAWRFNGWTFWVDWPGGGGFATVGGSGPREVAFDTFELSFPSPPTHWVGGTNEADRLTGTAGADELAGFGGDDHLDGAGGIDLARYGGPSLEHRVTRSGADWVVESTAAGRDTLRGVERLRFDDHCLAIDVDGHAGDVARTLNALFGRASLGWRDYAGIGLALLDDGVALAGLVALAVTADTFITAAGGSSNGAFVDWIYRNVVGSAPGDRERVHYTGLLDEGLTTRAALALLAVESEANRQQVALTGLGDRGLAYDPFGA